MRGSTSMRRNSCAARSPVTARAVRSRSAGYDFVLQAESGLMSICGAPGSGPTKYGVAIVDVCTGMLACNSILAALNARHRTAVGRRSRYRCTRVRWHARQCRLQLPRRRQRWRPVRNGHASIVPYTTYSAGDGMMSIAVAAMRNSPRCRPCSAIRNGRRIRALPATATGSPIAKRRRHDRRGFAGR